MNLKTKIAMASVSAIGILGAGAGVAMAQTTTSTPAPAAITPSAPGTTVVERPSSGEGTAETPGKEDPAEVNLPGGGHADPPGNVDHQFDGVE